MEDLLREIDPGAARGRCRRTAASLKWAGKGLYADAIRRTPERDDFAAGMTPMKSSSASGRIRDEAPARIELRRSDLRAANEPGAREDRSAGSVSANLGMRVRALRKEGGLTLNDLAERSGVSRAFLSAIERNEKSPTLPIIVRIAKGLAVTISSLLGDEPEAAEVALQRGRYRVAYRDPRSGFEREVLSASQAGSAVEIVLHRIPPKGSSGLLPAYETPTEKHIFVLEGELTAHIAEETYVVTPGDTLFFEVKAPYRLCNAGKQLCAYMVVMVRKG